AIPGRWMPYCNVRGADMTLCQTWRGALTIPRHDEQPPHPALPHRLGDMARRVGTEGDVPWGGGDEAPRDHDEQRGEGGRMVCWGSQRLLCWSRHARQSQAHLANI